MANGKTDLEMDRAELNAMGVDPDYNEYEGMGFEDDSTSMFDLGKEGASLGLSYMQLIAKKLGFEINPTEDNRLGFNEGGLMGFTAEGVAQEADKFAAEFTADDIEGLGEAGKAMIPFYDAGANMSNVVGEYVKPEEDRDYDYINAELGKAGKSAATEGAMLLLGGIAGKYGGKGIQYVADKVSEYEIDPTALSSFGAGAIKKKTPVAEDEMISVFPKPERMFPEGERPKGGDYLNPKTGEVLSGRNVSSAKLSISPEGKPSFKVSNDNVESVGSVGKGKTQIKTNLFKKKAGWKWLDAPEGMDGIETLISVENRGKHYYTIETDFSKGVNLKKYPNSKTEPRLRPTVVGELEIGPQIGTITVRGKEHPVYQNVRTFSEGGMVDDQMGAMFKSSRTGYNEGGAVPDNTQGIDPVSGNEVPIGSLPEEVRDDIPAQLSEGEYVVPADVVRYYGVKFFEDLRSEAKMGWSQMEQNGRIGGEPVAPTGMEMGQDEFPFSMEELQVVEAAEGAYIQGFNEGGMPSAGTPTSVTNPYNPAAASSGLEIKEYVHPDGRVMYIQFMNGKPLTMVPDGFKLKGTAAEEVAEQVAEQSTGQDDDDPTPTQVAKDPYADFDWKTAKVEDYQKAYDNMTGIGSKVASGIMGIMAGPIVGGALSVGMGSAKRNRAYDMLEGIEAQLEQPDLNKDTRTQLTKIQQQLQEQVTTGDDGKDDEGLVGKSGIFGGKTSMYEGLTDVSGDGRVTFADTWLGDLLGADGSAGVQGPGLSDSRGGARRSDDNDSDSSSSSTTQGGSNNSAQSGSKPSSFGEAFAAARKEQGSGGTFSYNGKSYSTNYAEEDAVSDEDE